MKSLGWIAACVVSLALAGCHGSGGTNSLASIRVLNAVVDAEPLDVLVADNAKATALAVGGTSAYTGLPVGTQNLKIRSSTTGAILLEKSVLFNTGTQTLYVYGRRNSISTLSLTDDTAAPSSGKAKVRTVNLSPESVAVDVYVTTTDIASATPTFTNVATGSSADFVEVNAGASTIAFTSTGTKDIRFQAANQNLAAGSSYGLVVFPSAGGGQLVNAVILTGGDGGTFVANASARVKGVNSMGDSTVVTFKADTTTLLSSVPFTAASSYVPTNAGDHTLRIEAANVPGVTIASLATTLAPSRDYSVVAIGDAAQPGLIALADQNYLPASGTARVRFVNALSGSTTVDVLVNFASQVSGLGPRGASDYYALSPGDSYTITFSNPGGVGVLATLSPVTIEAGVVYTVYLLGNPAAPKAALVRDR